MGVPGGGAKGSYKACFAQRARRGSEGVSPHSHAHQLSLTPSPCHSAAFLLFHTQACTHRRAFAHTALSGSLLLQASSKLISHFLLGSALSLAGVPAQLPPISGMPLCLLYYAACFICVQPYPSKLKSHRGRQAFVWSSSSVW